MELHLTEKLNITRYPAYYKVKYPESLSYYIIDPDWIATLSKTRCNLSFRSITSLVNNKPSSSYYSSPNLKYNEVAMSVEFNTAYESLSCDVSIFESTYYLVAASNLSSGFATPWSKF